MTCTCWRCFGMRKCACREHLKDIVCVRITFMRCQSSMPTIVLATVAVCAIQISGRSYVVLLGIVSPLHNWSATLYNTAARTKKHGVSMYRCCRCKWWCSWIHSKVHCAYNVGSSKFISVCQKCIVTLTMAWFYTQSPRITILVMFLHQFVNVEKQRSWGVNSIWQFRCHVMFKAACGCSRTMSAGICLIAHSWFGRMCSDVFGPFDAQTICFTWFGCTPDVRVHFS